MKELFEFSRLRIYLVLVLVVLLGVSFVYYQETKEPVASKIAQVNKTTATKGNGEPTAPSSEGLSSEEEGEGLPATPSLSEKIKEADKLMQNGEYEKARPLYEEIIKENPHQVSAYNSLAAIYAKKGDKEGALKVINQGLANNPNDFSLLQTKDLIEYVWFKQS